MVCQLHKVYDQRVQLLGKVGVCDQNYQKSVNTYARLNLNMILCLGPLKSGEQHLQASMYANH